MKFTIREHIAGINGLIASCFVLFNNLFYILMFTCFMLYWLWREKHYERI